MSLTRLPGALVLASLLGSSIAHAEEEKCRLGDPDCEEEKAAEREEARVVNVSGLVPLNELRRQPYAGLWFADFRFHQYEFGFSTLNLKLEGDVRVGTSSQSVSGANAYIGITGSYYVPLLGYSPNASIGLLPELHAVLGGFYSGSSSSSLDDLSEKKIGTALVLPLFLVARLGTTASRYGDWPVSLGAGIGAALVTWNAGEPVVDSGTFIQPMLKFEAAYQSFRLGYSMSLGWHDNFSSADDAVRLRYASQLFTFTLVTQPDPQE